MMVSLVIFSTLIGLSGRFVATGLNYPFIADRVEPWLVFMEETSLALKNLPNESELLIPGIHKNPFPWITPPANLDAWKLEWRGDAPTGIITAVFTATTNRKRIIEWYVYRKTP
ncbi:MAG: hypothetical protein GY866_25900 [Proteobacteria bacterium]|nr:hypothetical protein [Pseudomonadota bacterium]